MRWVRAPAATLKTVGGTSALYVRGDRALHVLSPSARLLFGCLEEPVSLPALVARLRDLTGAGEETIERDLREVLPDFERRGIVERVG